MSAESSTWLTYRPSRKLVLTIKLLTGVFLIWFLVSKISEAIYSQAIFSLPFSSQSIFWFLIAASLSFINWFLEAKKWQVLTSPFQFLPLLKAYKSVLAGLATGLITPNRLGNFIGRLAYISPQNKVQASVNTQIGNLAQFIVSILFGIISLSISYTYLYPTINRFIFVLTPFLMLALAIWLYFNPKSILKLPFGDKLMDWRAKEVTDLANFPTFLKWRTLAFSTSRYLIFTIQYYTLFRVFGVEESYLMIAILSAITFLITTVVPGIFMGKLLVRESAAIFVFSWIALPIQVILAVSFLLWFVNLALPSAFGWYFWIKKPKS